MGAQARERDCCEQADVARGIKPLPVAYEDVGGRENNQRAVLFEAVITVRLALVPVAKAGSIPPHAAAPPFGTAEPRLVPVEPEPQARRCSEPCNHVAILHHEVVFLLRADAARYAPILLAELHAVEERGGALGRHLEAGGAVGRGSPVGGAGGRGAEEEAEEGSRDTQLGLWVWQRAVY